MKVSSIIGLVVAIAGLYVGAVMEGSNPMAILNPSAMLIVLGGTLGAVIMGTSFDAIKNIPKMYMKVFNAERAGPQREGHRARRLRRVRPS